MERRPEWLVQRGGESVEGMKPEVEGPCGTLWAC